MFYLFMLCPGLTITDCDIEFNHINGEDFDSVQANGYFCIQKHTKSGTSSMISSHFDIIYVAKLCCTNYSCCVQCDKHTQ